MSEVKYDLESQPILLRSIHTSGSWTQIWAPSRKSTQADWLPAPWPNIHQKVLTLSRGHHQKANTCIFAHPAVAKQRKWLNQTGRSVARPGPKAVHPDIRTLTTNVQLRAVANQLILPYLFLVHHSPDFEHGFKHTPHDDYLSAGSVDRNDETLLSWLHTDPKVWCNIKYAVCGCPMVTFTLDTRFPYPLLLQLAV